MERGIRKILTFVKFLGNNTEALAISKRLQLPKMTEQVQILQRRLGCISRDLKVLWIA